MTLTLLLLAVYAAITDRTRRRRRWRLRVGRRPGDARRGARVPSSALADPGSRRPPLSPRSVRGCSPRSQHSRTRFATASEPLRRSASVLAEALQDPLAEIFFWIPETRGVRRHHRRAPRRVSRKTSVLVARSSRDDMQDRVAAARSDAARTSRPARWRPRRGLALDRDGAPPGRGTNPARRGRGFARTHRRGRLRGAPSARARPPRRGAAAPRLARRAGQATPAEPAPRSAESSRLRSTRSLPRSERRSPTSGRSPPAFGRLGSTRGSQPRSRDLARTSPVPVDVEATGERAPASVEAAAYFVACEALTNAVKHGSPSRITVRALEDNGTLHVTVADDGVGGAVVRRGSGLAGLRDRVAAHGGTLEIVSPHGSGTRVEVAIPCGS